MLTCIMHRNQIFRKLRMNDNINDHQLNKIHSPIGIDIGAETVEEIAVSIVAELIKVRRNITS